MRRITHIFYFFSLVLFFTALPSFVHAADPKPTIRDSSYAASYVSQSIVDPVEIEVGQTKTVVFRLKNAGTKTWNSLSQHSDGARHISAYTMEPRDRDSLFYGSTWVSAQQTGSITKDTKPGDVAELSIDFKAPEKTGDYVEHFYLAAENYTWVKGGYFFVKIKVLPKTTKVELEPETPVVPPVEQNQPTLGAEYQAVVLAQNIKSISLRGGETARVVLVYKNKGSAAWNGYALSGTAGFQDISWKTSTHIVEDDSVVAADGFVRKEVIIRAPQKRGTYTASLAIVLDDKVVSGSESDVHVTVTEDALGSSIGQPAQPAPPEEPRLSSEPRIRVGLTTPSNFIQVVSFDDEYTVLNGGNSMGILPKKKVAIIKYDNGSYSFQGAGLVFDTTSVIRLQPVNDPHATFTALNLNRGSGLEWVGKSNFNRYHGALEYQQGKVDKQMYLVNDLLLEDYTKGITETGTGAPIEFVKANLVAARTYAYAGRGKYPFFDTLGSTYDQLYLGAEVAEIKPDIAAAAEATRGYMVTYNNDIVTTPYFGRSNGKTKSWVDVWGGKVKPWLVPVVAKYDAGKTQRGHGVGMSQTDASLRAQKDGTTWQELLTYYYQNTEVKKIYK